MSEEAKIEVPQMLQEMLAMEQNVETLSKIEAFLGQVTVKGIGDVKDLSRCLNWIEGMKSGTRARAEQIRAQLPKQPEATPDAAPADQITVGPLEAEKGSPVLGPA